MEHFFSRKRIYGKWAKARKMDISLETSKIWFEFSLGVIVMHKVNTTKMVEVTWSSPKGKFVGAGKEISEELGRKPESTDLNERHPFDVEILLRRMERSNCTV